jgi:hypothetical protein
MKKTRFFALAGLTTLAVVSVFGTKPTKKFGAVSTISNGSVTLFSGTSTILTTTATFPTCQFRIGTGGTAVTLKTSSGSDVYFH